VWAPEPVREFWIKCFQRVGISTSNRSARSLVSVPVPECSLLDLITMSVVTDVHITRG